MKEYTRRNRPSLPFFSGRRKSASIQYETELTLHYSKDQLFNRHVLLPHAELNAAIYDDVNKFVQKYRGEEMTLYMLCDPVSEAVQNTFREVYRSHYDDEYRKLTHYLNRRYARVLGLLLISVAAYYIGRSCAGFAHGSSFLLEVISNIGVFCLWEIG